MRLRVLGIGATTVLLLTLVTGVISTGAWFTGLNVMTGNTLAAGRLDVMVRADHRSSSPIVLQEMEPGTWYGPYPITIYNPDGGTPVKYRIFASKLGGRLAEKLQTRLAYGRCTPHPGDWTRSPERLRYVGPLSELYIESPITAANRGVLPAKQSHCWMISFKVDESAGNEYKSAWATFSLVVEATQIENPNWGQ